MKRRRIRLAVCVLLITMAAFLTMPQQRRAEAADDPVPFSSFEELKALCDRYSHAENEAETILVCTTAGEILIPEDLTIPAGTAVTFCRFAVAEGVTLSVEADVQVLTNALKVEGELRNTGTVIQQDLGIYEGSEEIEVAAWIPGHIDNRGSMILTNVFGKRNIRSFGGHLTMNETEDYDRLLRGDDATETPEPAATLAPTPTPETEGKTGVTKSAYDMIEELFRILEKVLPPAAFFLTVFLALRGVRTAIQKTGKRGCTRKTSAPQFRRQEPSGPVTVVPGEDNFQHDKRSRIAQLDEWLRNGLIDRKEYQVLKQRYEQDNR